MINERTTLVVVNQRKNLRELANRRSEEVCGAIAGKAIYVLLFPAEL
jgi:hypothetical protein